MIVFALGFVWVWLQLIFLGIRPQMSEASRRSRVTITLGRSGQVRFLFFASHSWYLANFIGRRKEPVETLALVMCEREVDLVLSLNEHVPLFA